MWESLSGANSLMHHMLPCHVVRFKYLCMSSYFRLLVRILESCAARRGWGASKKGDCLVKGPESKPIHRSALLLTKWLTVTYRCVFSHIFGSTNLATLNKKSRLIIFAALLLVVFFGFAVAFSRLAKGSEVGS